MTAAVQEQLVIDQPGVYDIPVDAYHADPVAGGSLSSTGARTLLPPGCPARYIYDKHNPPEPKKTYDLGHAAHQLVLGTGPELVRIDREIWNTNLVKDQVAEVRGRGAVPLKPSEYEQVQAMAAALRDHPVASALFRPGSGKAEQTLVWVDQRSGVWRRALLDWLPHFTVYDREGQPTAPPGYPGRVILPDYKTCRSANTRDAQKAIAEYGYHAQAAWYIAGVKALFPAWRNPSAPDPAFVFVFQEKTPPYLVNVVEPDTAALRIGQARNDWALDIYSVCVAEGRWPGYSDEVVRVSLPTWAEAEQEKEMNL